MDFIIRVHIFYSNISVSMAVLRSDWFVFVNIRCCHCLLQWFKHLFTQRHVWLY